MQISTLNMIRALSEALELMCEGGVLVADNFESKAVSLLLAYSVPKTKDFIYIEDANESWIWRVKTKEAERTDWDGDTIILCDFDGTITKKDVSVALLDEFTEGNWRSSVRSVVKGNTGSKQAYKIIEDKINGEEDKMREFVRNFEIEDGFQNFIEFVKERNMEFAIVSDGFSFYISEILRKHGFDAKFHASEIVKGKNRKFKFYFPNQSEFCELCATCKLKILRKYKERKNFIIFIGNGISDRCAVEEADFIFAKSRLKEICYMKGLDFSPFETFYDIVEVMKLKPKCFVIDFDGTLGWSFEGIKDAFTHTFRKLKKDMPKDVEKLIGLPLHECFKISLGSDELAEKAVEIFRKRYRKVFLKKTFLPPGAKETVEKLRELGYKVVILSNKHGDVLRELVKHLEIEADLIIGEGDIVENGKIHFKPSPKVIEYIEKEMKVDARDMIVVGDTEIDLMTALNSGAVFCGLLSPTHSPQHFEEKGKVNFFISSIKGLIKIAEFYMKMR